MLFRYSDVGRDRHILAFIRAWVVARMKLNQLL